jgi:uncharacterized membrane protein
MKKKWILASLFIGTTVAVASIFFVGCGDATGGKVTLRGGNQ